VARDVFWVGVLRISKV